MAKRRPHPSPVEFSRTRFGKAFSDLRASLRVSSRELAQRAGYATVHGNLSKYELGVLLPPPKEIILRWMWHLGFPEGSPETQGMLALAADDHCDAIREHYSSH